MKETTALAELAAWGLVVVDMQNDFLAEGGYYARRRELDRQLRQSEIDADTWNRLLCRPAAAPEGEFRYRDAALAPVVDNIVRTIEYARHRHCPVAYLQAVYSRELDIQPPSLQRNLDRRHHPCHPHSWGAAFIDPIGRIISAGNMTSRERVIQKHTFDGCFRTGLLEFLQDQQVKTVVLTGVETHVCVLTTAQSAATSGFRTLILEDCVWTARAELGEPALAIFRDAFGATARLNHGCT